MTFIIRAVPRPCATLRAGVRLSRGPLRFRAAHRSQRSRPSHPSRIPSTLQLLSATAAQRSGPLHSTPYANAAHRSSLLASLFTRLAMAPVAAFSRPTLPKTYRTHPAQLTASAAPCSANFASFARLTYARYSRCRLLPPAEPGRSTPDATDTSLTQTPPCGPLPAGQPAAPPPTQRTAAVPRRAKKAPRHPSAP